MTEAIHDERVLDFVDRYLASLTEGGDEPDLDALEEPLRSLALQYLRALDLLDADEEYPMPALADDPIARRFGWDRPARTIRISTAALKESARAAGMQLSELAEKLTVAGRPTQPKDLLRLVRDATATIDSDLAARLAAILDTSVPELAAANYVTAPTRTLDDLLGLETARSLIETLARKLGESFESIESSVRGKLMATAFRHGTEDAWLQALRVALKEVERERAG